MYTQSVQPMQPTLETMTTTMSSPSSFCDSFSTPVSSSTTSSLLGSTYAHHVSGSNQVTTTTETMPMPIMPMTPTTANSSPLVLRYINNGNMMGNVICYEPMTPPHHVYAYNSPIPSSSRCLQQYAVSYGQPNNNESTATKCAALDSSGVCGPTTNDDQSLQKSLNSIDGSQLVPQVASPSDSLTDSDLIDGSPPSYTRFENNDYYYIKKKERIIATSTSKTNLYIRGLGKDTNDKDLHDLCEKYGEIKSTKAIIDKQTSKCKGYGFVDFRRQDDAKHALAELKKDQKDVQLANQREQDPTNLYFANLPVDIDDDVLSNMLKSRFNARVSSTRIMREKNGVSKGVGFARIDDDKICDKIILQLNAQPFPDHSNKGKLIMVKLADSCSIIKPNKPFRYGNSNDQLYHNNSLGNSSNSLSHTGSINDSNSNTCNLIYNHHFSNPPPPHQYIDFNYNYPIMVAENHPHGQTTLHHTQQPQEQPQQYTTNIPLLQSPSNPSPLSISNVPNYNTSQRQQQLHQHPFLANPNFAPTLPYGQAQPHALIQQQQTQYYAPYHPQAFSTQHQQPQMQTQGNNQPNQMPYYVISHSYQPVQNGYSTGYPISPVGPPMATRDNFKQQCGEIF